MPYLKAPEADELAKSSPRPMWRPWTLRTPSLCFSIALCVFLLISTEIATSGCAKTGCHVFGKSFDGTLPPASHFVYSQFPTALSVGLSLLWILPHHDICRLEPYFRMSVPGGEKAGASLFLDYPYQVAIFLPFRALYKKHYVVALSSIILLLMNFVIVPFVANFFDHSAVITSFTGNAMRASFDVSRNNVSASSTFWAYDYAWRSGQLAPFMTDTYALLPLKTGGYTFARNETWTFETTLFEAEMNCSRSQKPAIGYFNNTLRVNITSADGDFVVHLCDAGALAQDRLLLNPDQDKSCHLYTAFTTPWTSIYWQMENKMGPMAYMFAWASGPPSSPNTMNISMFPAPNNITAVFCTPLYYSQTVNATISMPSGNVLNVSRTGQKTYIGSRPDFDGIIDGNYTQQDFTNEGLVLNVTVKLPVRFGYPTQITASVASELLSRFGQSMNPLITPWLGLASMSNIYMTFTNSLASFSLFNQSNSTLSELLDAPTLERTIERGLKILFAFAMAEMVSNSATSTWVPVEREAWAIKITVNPDWALAARIGLTVIALLVGLLLFLVRRRPCQLYGEPNNMAASLRLLSVSPALCAAMRYAEFHDPKVLSHKMDADGLYFKLDLDTVNRTGSTIRVIRGTGDAAIEVDNPQLLQDPGDAAPAKSKKTWTMVISTWSLGFLPILAGLLIFVFAYSRVNKGFPISGDNNSFLSKILYTYLPLAAASAVEIILIEIGVRQCMMGPYKALENKAHYTKSLAADYDERPPHFQLHSSVINSEYILTAISMAILLSNVLSVAIVGLFPATPEAIMTPRSHQISKIFPISRQDMYYKLEKTLTSDYPLAWTTSEYYIDPPYENTPLAQNEYSTVGFGMDIICTQVPGDRVTFPCSQQYSFSKQNCAKAAPSTWDNVMAIRDECTTSYIRWNGSCRDAMITCRDWIIPLWVQNMKFNVTPPGSPDGAFDDYRWVALNCSFADKIVNLTAEVKNEEVLSVADVRSLDRTQLASLYPMGASPVMNNLSHGFVNALSTSITNDQSALQNHRLARINYLMATLNQSVLREPKNMTHIPNAVIARPVFEGVMRRMFALLLQSSADDMFLNGTALVRGGTNRYRVHVEPVSFAVSLSIVLFSCGVVVAVYWGQKREVVRHLPYSLGGMYSHLYASNIKEDMMMVREMSLEQIRRRSKFLGRAFHYGRYPDGSHYGVYRVETGEERLLTQQKEPEVEERGLEMDDL